MFTSIELYPKRISLRIIGEGVENGLFFNTQLPISNLNPSGEWGFMSIIYGTIYVNSSYQSILCNIIYVMWSYVF